MTLKTRRLKLRIKMMKAMNKNPFVIMESIYYDCPKMTPKKIFELVMKTK